MPVEVSKALIQTINKIPLFKGLAPSSIRSVLGMCTARSFEAEEEVCRIDTLSDEMYILLAGELAVITGDGLCVASIKPVTTVGELGVVMRQPRITTVRTVWPSKLFVIQRSHFEHLLRDNRELQARIYHNIIEILCDKLRNDNIRMRTYLLEKKCCEEGLREAEIRCGILLELLAEQSAMSPEQIEDYIREKEKDEVRRILIVDDEEGIRRLVKRLLAAFIVLEAENGQRALALVEEEEPDLVITDIRMPGMDGMELMAHLRAKRPGLPVLALSGYVDEAEIEGRGFAGFLKKPIRLEDLKELVEDRLA